MTMVGGLGSAQPANDEIQQICDKVKGEVATKAGKSFEMFIATQYKSQVVAGSNYYIKVKVGSDSWIHIKVFKQLPQAGEGLSVTAVQEDATENAEIVFF